MDESYQDWHGKIVRDITSSLQWESLSTEIFSWIQEELKKQGSECFSDLTFQAQNALIAQAYAALQEGTLSTSSEALQKYQDLKTLVCSSTELELGVQLQNEMKAHPEHGVTVALGSVAEKAILELLGCIGNDPWMELMPLAGHSLPAGIRPHLWTLRLSQSKAADRFLKDLDDTSYDPLSEFDDQVTNRCKELLQVSGSLNSRRNLSALKTALSWYQLQRSREQKSSQLPDHMYWLALEIVWIYSDFFPVLNPEQHRKRDPLMLHLIQSIDMLSSPGGIVPAGVEHYEGPETDFLWMRPWAERTHELLLLLPGTDSLNKHLKTLANTAGQEEQSLLFCLQLMAGGFVEALKFDAVSFVWDQGFLLGMNTVIPATAALLLFLAQDALLRCENYTLLRDTFVVTSRRVSQLQIQETFCLHIMPIIMK